MRFWLFIIVVWGLLAYAFIAGPEGIENIHAISQGLHITILGAVAIFILLMIVGVVVAAGVGNVLKLVGCLIIFALFAGVLAILAPLFMFAMRAFPFGLVLAVAFLIVLGFMVLLRKND
jgi:hypothetical protein